MWCTLSDLCVLAVHNPLHSSLPLYFFETNFTAIIPINAIAWHIFLLRFYLVDSTTASSSYRKMLKTIHTCRIYFTHTHRHTTHDCHPWYLPSDHKYCRRMHGHIVVCRWVPWRSAILQMVRSVGNINKKHCERDIHKNQAPHHPQHSNFTHFDWLTLSWNARTDANALDTPKNYWRWNIRCAALARSTRPMYGWVYMAACCDDAAIKAAQQWLIRAGIEMSKYIDHFAHALTAIICECVCVVPNTPAGHSPFVRSRPQETRQAIWSANRTNQTKKKSTKSEAR